MSPEPELETSPDIQRAAGPEPEPTRPPLVAGFEGAFQPGGAAQFDLEKTPAPGDSVRPKVTVRLV